MQKNINLPLTPILLLLLGITLFGVIKLVKRQPAVSQYAVVSSPVQTNDLSCPVLGEHFQLLDKHGNTFSSQQLLGSYSLLYFGFTFCPDVCPATLKKLDEAVAKLKEQGITANIAFISVDPERDNAALLNDYLVNFDNEVIGLTGTLAQISEVAAAFKVFYEKVPFEYGQHAKMQGQASSKTNYLVNHTSLVYLMDKDFKYHSSFHLENSVADIVERIQKLDSSHKKDAHSG